MCLLELYTPSGRLVHGGQPEVVELQAFWPGDSQFLLTPCSVAAGLGYPHPKSLAQLSLSLRGSLQGVCVCVAGWGEVEAKMEGS